MHRLLVTCGTAFYEIMSIKVKNKADEEYTEMKELDNPSKFYQNQMKIKEVL